MLSACHKQSLLWAPAAPRSRVRFCSIPFVFISPEPSETFTSGAEIFLCCASARGELWTAVFWEEGQQEALFSPPSHGKGNGITFAKWHQSPSSLSQEMDTTHSWKWLAEEHLQAHEKYFIELKLQGVTWEMVWYSPSRPSQSCTGNACSHFWGAPLPRHHPRDWERAGNWDISKRVQNIQKKNAWACLIPSGFLL